MWVSVLVIVVMWVNVTAQILNYFDVLGSLLPYFKGETIVVWLSRAFSTLIIVFLAAVTVQIVILYFQVLAVLRKLKKLVMEHQLQQQLQSHQSKQSQPRLSQISRP